MRCSTDRASRFIVRDEGGLPQKARGLQGWNQEEESMISLRQ